MPHEFAFTGLILPNVHPLTVAHRPTAISDVLPCGPAQMTLAVEDGRFQVAVKAQSFDEGVWKAMFGPASDLVRTVVEATGFVEGVPYAATIDTLVTPSGEERHVGLGDPCLALRHGFSPDDTRRIAELLLDDFPLALAMSDLLMALSKTHYSPISCGRVADCLARLLAPGEAPKAAWPKLRAALNVDEAYVRLLTDHSKPGRHGDRQPLSANLTAKIADRGWTLMGRYLRLKLDGPLDIVAYPLLRG